MQLIFRLFPASYYLDPASETAFRHSLVDSARQGTRRLALICIVLMLVFSLTDVLAQDHWLSLNNIARYLAAICITGYLLYSSKLKGEQWLQGWLAVAAVSILLLSISFYATAQSFGRLGEGGPLVIAFAVAAVPIFHLQQKLLLWLFLLSLVAFLKYCMATDTGWNIFYLLITISLCISWQRQFDILMRSQFKAVRLEQQKAETDQLTGLLNRRSFEQRLMQKLTELSNGQQLSLGLLDIDYFKRYNDHYGHLDGDLVLVQIARLLSANAALTVVRFGGEEFILIEQHAATEAAALLQLPAQLASLAIPHAASPFGVVTASIGIVTLTDPTRVSGSGELMQQADALLYQAKLQGRNQACQILLK